MGKPSGTLSTMKSLDIVAAVAVPIIWGMGIVVAKPAVDQFPPILLMAMRFSVSALILVWFVPIPRGVLKQLFWVALVAFLGIYIVLGEPLTPTCCWEVRW